MNSEQHRVMMEALDVMDDRLAAILYAIRKQNGFIIEIMLQVTDQAADDEWWKDDDEP